MEEEIRNELDNLKDKINEIVECLTDNELFKKTPVEEIYEEEEEDTEDSTAKETFD